MAVKTLTPYINGGYTPQGGRAGDEIRSPFDGRVLAHVVPAGTDEFEAAVKAAQGGFAAMRALPRHARRDILERVAARLKADRQALAEILVHDAGKPISQALGEVDRASTTFALAADEVSRFGGEVIPLDVDPRADAMQGLVARFPVGPIAAISPFNFPLNLVAHKVAPCIAVGSALVLKPPPQAPLAAFRLGEILAECGLPNGGYNVLPMPIPLAERLATDPRFGMLTFTGSAKVGWHLKGVAGKKRVALELGGNAAAVVHEDLADLDWTAQRLAIGAFAYAGQVCIKVQRLLVHRPIYDTFVKKFVAASAALPVGDPCDPATVVGPMIDQGNVQRVVSWIAEAEQAGAQALLKGERNGTLLGPTILANAPKGAKVSCEEIFGPVATVAPYDTWDEAIALVNDSAFGLQTGVFTQNVNRIFQAFNRLEVGGVIANDFPTMRVDNYPYGGVKDSGFGREGVRYAMEEMTESRMLVLNLKK